MLQVSAREAVSLYVNNKKRTYIVCRVCGRRHFDRWGAAGLLLVRRDQTRRGNPPTEVLLHHRSTATASGNTWALPGGIVDPQAVRHPQAEEEVGLLRRSTRGRDPLLVVRREVAILDHGAWKYTYVIAELKREFRPRITDGEGLGVKWVPVEMVRRRRLHPDFAEAWPRLLRRMCPPLVATDEPMSDVKPDDQGVLQNDNEIVDVGFGQNRVQGTRRGVIPDDAYILEEDYDEDILSRAVPDQSFARNNNQQDAVEVEDQDELEHTTQDVDRTGNDILNKDNDVDTINEYLAQKDAQNAVPHDDHQEHQHDNQNVSEVDDDQYEPWDETEVDDDQNEEVVLLDAATGDSDQESALDKDHGMPTPVAKTRINH